MKFHSTVNKKFQFLWKYCWKIFYKISLFYLITSSPVSTLTGCTVTIINIELRNLQVLCDHEHAKLNGIPKNMKIETRILEMSMQNITNLERNSFEEVQYLKKLIIKSSNLKNVDRLAFKHLSHLESLNLRNNSLELTESSLPRDCFQFLISLKYLDLSQNPINFISDFYFKFLNVSLLSLSLSDLADNLLLSTHSLSALHQLEYLDLTFNKFETLQKGLLGNIIQRSYYNATTVLLTGNLWNCDCKLRWLREWYYHNLPRITINLIEEIRPGLRKTLKPFCHNPIHMRRKYLFPSSYSMSFIQEMKCEERPLTNSTTVRVQENSNVTLQCTFIINDEKNYEDRVQWYKDGITMGWTKKSKYISRFKVDNFRLFTKLSIYGVKLDDGGKWECRLVGEDNLRKIASVIQLIIKSNDLTILSNRSKKLLIYTSVSLLTFLLIIFLIAISFYFCFRYHRTTLSLKHNRKPNHNTNGKDIRPKCLSITPQGNHFLLYDDSHVTDDKMFSHYKPLNPNFIEPCVCKECSINMKNSTHFGNFPIDSHFDLCLQNNDSKKISPCPIHGDCNISLKEIVPNIETKKSCPIHGHFNSDHMGKTGGEIKDKYGSLKLASSTKPLILSDQSRNDIALSPLNKNKNPYLDCPLHGKVLSLNHY